MFLKGRLTRSSFAGKAVVVLHAFLFILIVFNSQSMAAQEADPILFHAVILDSDTREPLTGAHFQVRGRSSGAADSRGMVSFYARHRDTVVFTSVGYKEYQMTVHDTLRAIEYVAGIYLTTDTLMMAAVVVMPRIGNIRAAIMSEPPLTNQEMINATNNLRLSTYQGLTSANRLGDPDSNYELLRHQQRTAAYEKGQIPSDKMIGLSPLTVISLIYLLAVGPPEAPRPPVPHISAREMESLRTYHDSLIYRVPR